MSLQIFRSATSNQPSALTRKPMVSDSSYWLLSGGWLAVLQASMLDGLSFGPFSLFDDGLSSTEAGIGMCNVAEALVATLVVVVLDEGFNLVF